MSSALCMLRSVPLGKYCRSSPLVISFVPRCHGLCGCRSRLGRPRRSLGVRAEPSQLLDPKSATTQVLRQGDDRVRDGVAHRVGTMSSEGGCSSRERRGHDRHAGQMQQQSRNRIHALYQCPDHRNVKTQDASFLQCPGTARSTASAGRWLIMIFGRGRRPCLVARARPRYPERSPGAQARRQLAPQRASSLNEQRLVEGFMANAHGLIVGKSTKSWRTMCMGSRRLTSADLFAAHVDGLSRTRPGRDECRWE